MIVWLERAGLEHTVACKPQCRVALDGWAGLKHGYFACCLTGAREQGWRPGSHCPPPVSTHPHASSWGLSFFIPRKMSERCRVGGGLTERNERPTVQGEVRRVCTWASCVPEAHDWGVCRRSPQCCIHSEHPLILFLSAPCSVPFLALGRVRVLGLVRSPQGRRSAA